MFKMQREHRKQKANALRSSLEGLERNDDVSFQTEYKNAPKNTSRMGYLSSTPSCTLYSVLCIDLKYYFPSEIFSDNFHQARPQFARVPRGARLKLLLSA